MSTTIDGAGRLVIPKNIRRRVGLADGGAVDVVERDGVIEITPSPVETELVDTGHGAALRRTGDGESLTSEDVRSVMESQRR